MAETELNLNADMNTDMEGSCAPGTAFSIRKMELPDREAVILMMRDFYSSEAVLTNGSDEIFENDFAACVSDSPFIDGYVFTDAAGRTAGYAMTAHSFSTEFGRPCVWIEDLYLREELRGLGAASAFFDMLAESYPDAVHRLEAEDENRHAMDIYRRKGFSGIPYVEMIRNTER